MIRRSKHGFSHLLDAISAPRFKCFRVSGSRGSTFGRFGGTELGRNRSGSLRSTRSSCHFEISCKGKKRPNADVSRLQDELPEPEPHECRATSQLCWVHVFENSKTCFFGALQALKIYKSIKILSFFSQNLCPFWCLPLVSNRYCPPLNCLELTCRFGSILSRWLKESCPQPL